ncbi:MAG: hypothetical protein COT55_03160 [Candidatus Diapherotrites archaeon CG09_land_8_20_14_0_10_32_12]|nr:MAG: hypothetical protein COT55_03160 [Candidatus Diapherotrites archaeon CG09_land_8_20_14_0_10_32_12]
METIREFISTVFVVKDGKVLMTWNKKVNNWIPIGGHIEQNELPCTSVIREAKEESGLDIELIHPFDKAETANLTQPIHIHLDHIKEDHKHINLIYFGTVKGGDCFEIDDEGKKLKWFSKEELEKEDLLPNIKEWATKALRHLGDKY